MIRLVDNWRDAWKWASVRMAMVAGAVGTTSIMAWPFLNWTMNNYVPEGIPRHIAAVVLGLVMFIIPTIARITKKERKDAPAE